MLGLKRKWPGMDDEEDRSHHSKSKSSAEASSRNRKISSSSKPDKKIETRGQSPKPGKPLKFAQEEPESDDDDVDDDDDNDDDDDDDDENDENVDNHVNEKYSAHEDPIRNAQSQQFSANSSSTSSVKSNKKKPALPKRKKNHPLELTSKSALAGYIKPPSDIVRKVGRDPRFHDLNSEHNPHIFRKDYAFLDEMKESELNELKAQVKKEKDAEKKIAMIGQMNRFKEELKKSKAEEEKYQLAKALRAKEKALVEQGKKPFYHKKSELKTLGAANQFLSLQASGGLDKFIEKKRKKTASKDVRYMPQMS
jgi:ribosomal RNA-processing protein 36